MENFQIDLLDPDFVEVNTEYSTGSFSSDEEMYWKKMNLKNNMTRTVEARNDCPSKWENLVLGGGRDGLRRRFGRERCQTAATAKGG